MPTITAGNTAQVTIPAGSVLLIGDGSYGEIQFTSGQASGQTIKVDSASEVVGPYGSNHVVNLTSTAGRLTYTLAASTGVPLQVSGSRDIAATDNGQTLECTTTVTLTVPLGLPAGFGCAVIPSGTTSIASSGGTLLNGATTTLTRAASTNAIIAIVSRGSAADSYVVTGT